jgi:hypothetical protein
VALRYAGKNSSVFVCGDVSVGGLSLNGFPYREDSGIAVLGLNSTGDPWLTWATGPNGSPRWRPGPQGAGEPGTPPSPPSSEDTSEEPAALHAAAALNIAADTVAFGEGPGAEAVRGTLESTAIFEIIRNNL